MNWISKPLYLINLSKQFIERCSHLFDCIFRVLWFLNVDVFNNVNIEKQKLSFLDFIVIKNYWYWSIIMLFLSSPFFVRMELSVLSAFISSIILFNAFNNEISFFLTAMPITPCNLSYNIRINSIHSICFAIYKKKWDFIWRSNNSYYTFFFYYFQSIFFP